MGSFDRYTIALCKMVIITEPPDPLAEAFESRIRRGICGKSWPLWTAASR